MIEQHSWAAMIVVRRLQALTVATATAAGSMTWREMCMSGAGIGMMPAGIATEVPRLQKRAALTVAYWGRVMRGDSWAVDMSLLGCANGSLSVDPVYEDNYVGFRSARGL